MEPVSYTHLDGETAREFLNDIGDEADRLTRITEKLLTLTRLDTAPAAEDVPVDVGAVVAVSYTHLV